MSEKTIFEQAVEKWGPISQVLMVAEEAGELVSVLNQWIRNRACVTRVAEEVADMEIMLEQIPHIVGVTGFDPGHFRELVDATKARKIARLRTMLSEGQADE